MSEVHSPEECCMSHSLRVRRHHIMLLVAEMNVARFEAAKNALYRSDTLDRAPVMYDDLLVSVITHPITIMCQ